MSDVDNAPIKTNNRRIGRTRTETANTSSTSSDPGGAGSCEEEAAPPLPEINPPGIVHHQIATRLSTGSLGRKSKKEPSPPPPDSPTKKPGLIEIFAFSVLVHCLPPAENTEPETRIRRQWELWSVEDKNVFFEAINEHGKDFDAIQSALAKHKKKGGPAPCSDVKSKNQVRHYYYRTCQNIFKLVNLSQFEQGEGISRQALELYGLINYGELRKKYSGKLDSKNAERLSELIFKGFTIVKVKGKKYQRIKTPTCKALKKLNHIDDQKEETGTKIPDSVIFELKPLNNKAWTHVQALAHNPRLRISLKPNRSLAAIFNYLHRKWLPRRRERLDLPSEDLSEEVKLHLTSHEKLKPFRLKASNSALKTELDFKHFLQRTQDQTEISPKRNDSRVPSQTSESDAEIERDNSSDLQTDKIKRLSTGMVRSDVEDIKVGEVFFMLGNPSKVTLEYEWIQLRPQVTPELVDFHSDLSNMLRRLVHLANPEFSDVRKPKIPTSPPSVSQCTCGANKTSTPPQKRGLKTTNGPSTRAVVKSPNANKASQVPILPKPDSKTANSDAVFRVPTSIPRRAKPVADSMDTTENIVARHLESFIPKKQRRVPRKRPLEVVQRTLLPKAQTPDRQIMTLAMLGPTSPSAPMMRVVASPAYAIQSDDSTPEITEKPRITQPRRIIPTPIPKNSEPGTFPPASIVRNSHSPSTEILTTDIPKEKPSMPDGSMFGEMDSFLVEPSAASTPLTTSSGQLNGNHSPNSMSSFLDLSLPSTADASEGAEKYLDISLDSSSNGFAALLEAPSLAKKDESKVEESPSKVYKRLTSEDQWIHTEEFSLSHLLDESPEKKQKVTSGGQPEVMVQPSASVNVSVNECSRDSLKLDVDSTLQCMLNENSLEYTSKFADLAAQIASQSEHANHAK
ncbi:hypothetical protein CAPTEDRAFT_206971 [Capitella teleta]|uniref:Myb-like domain-containing protein n=1 Tax=Capitella teleta TaxID=283909 RepID=R7UQU1_CAPTE|nr:hypothetical protein CAPTEDRAFT_206971 [Capitella teleta]|eukprot:ELU08899.1 hypothetical protein CAPTEDRAFT_206971 [Capitella teleta]